MDELMDSLDKSSDFAAGPDDIHYQMLKHLFLQMHFGHYLIPWITSGSLATFLLHGIIHI